MKIDKKTVYGVSAAALLIGVSSGSAYAQQADQTTTQASAPKATSTPDQVVAGDAEQEADRVVVTGSLIATTPEDAAKPVEVYTAQDLQEAGSPSMVDFLRSLTSSYESLGEATNGAGSAGYASVNLRGVGSSGTLTLMNGRPVSPWSAFGSDTNTIPMEALEAVDILKDGASATYGGGAVGGVINFRTRRDIDAPQLTVEKTFYDGSDGAYKIDFLTGWVGDASNLLISLSHSNEDGMLQSARGFSSQPYSVNPASYTLTGGDVGLFQTSPGFLTATTSLGTAAPGIADYRTASDCRAVGGEIVSTLQPGALTGTTPNPACGFGNFNFQDVVNKTDVDRAYIEFNADLSESMEFHFDLAFNKNESIQRTFPSGAAGARTAIDRGTGTSCSTCNYVVPVTVNAYNTAGAIVPGSSRRNPFIDDFIARTGATVGAGDALYMGGNWRPFLFGGLPITESNLLERLYRRESLIANIAIKGEFSEDGLIGKLLGPVGYDLSAQYNNYSMTYVQPDIFASRLQNALLGYGGPGCAAVDRVATDYSSTGAFNRTVGIQSDTLPGTNGCQWFNPFASSFATSIANGAANPQFNAGQPVLGAGATARPTGYANPIDMIDWMVGERKGDEINEGWTFTALFNGELPDQLSLPGGPVGWAVGAQGRHYEVHDHTYDRSEIEERMNEQLCVWPDLAVVESPVSPAQRPGMRGCATQTGAFHSAGVLNLAGVVTPYYADIQTTSFFGEVQLPVLDNVNLSASARHEEYNTGIAGDIWSVAGKWNITDDLYLRSSYSTNFRQEIALQLNPGGTTIDTTTEARFGAGVVLPRSTTVAGVGPEDDTTFNIGIGYQADIGEGRFRASADFFEIMIDGQVATTSSVTILNNIFGLNTASCQADRTSATCVGAGGEVATGLPVATAGGLQYADCNARLISFVAFSTPCTQGVTTNLQISEVQRQQVNGPGFASNGIDYSIDYSHPLWDGIASFQLTATQSLVYKARGYKVNGIVFESGGHRLGYGNVTRTGDSSSRWRANATVRWSNDQHNIGLRANYNSGFYDEAWDISALTPIINNPGTTPDVFSTYGIFTDDYLDFDVNYLWTPPFWEGLQLRASVFNLTDEDPIAAQNGSGYFTGIGNPRGRRFEVGLTQKF